MHVNTTHSPSLTLNTFVEESGQERYCAHVVAGGFAVVIQVGLGVSHAGPEVGVDREHGLVLVGLGTLQGKVEGESGPPAVQSFKVELGQGILIFVLITSMDVGHGLLLDYLYLPDRVLGEATVERDTLICHTTLI